jgi:hypothetical protein
MKKLTLTFCALFVVFAAAAPAIYAGPEQYSGKKEVMQPAPPVCDLYRAHEWDLDIWGTYAFAGDTGRFDVPNDDPFTPDIDPGTYVGSIVDGSIIFTSTVSQPADQNPNERINLGRVSKGQLFGGRDEAWGGGVDAKYFWSRYFGVGVEGVGLAAKTNFVGGGLGTLTVRFPFGRFAPYAFGGAGVIGGGGTEYKFFNEKHEPGLVGEREFFTVDEVHNTHARFLGQLGAGLEFRITCHIGLMADFAWNFVAGSSSSDKFSPVLEQGDLTIVNDRGGVLLQQVIINRAVNVHPGQGSDNQDFGMARFGVTFSY